ncbi:MAG: hypothetical protein E6Q97_02570 [Desulfurellales bacterium]|nr:MAG: hypothetical protein E6Q97_02570 [Desulfurellales bacterium]
MKELYDLAYPVRSAPVDWLDEPVEVLAMSAAIDYGLREFKAAETDFKLLKNMIDINGVTV